jgi:hypothetical protein
VPVIIGVTPDFGDTIVTTGTGISGKFIFQVQARCYEFFDAQDKYRSPGRKFIWGLEAKCQYCCNDFNELWQILSHPSHLKISMPIVAKNS